jgi:hypothetical protein
MGRGASVTDAPDIEFLAPDERAFPTSNGSTVTDDAWAHAFEFDDEPARSSWPTVVAGLAVGALLVVGVVASFPGDETAPAPSTVVPAPTTASTVASTDVAVATSAIGVSLHYGLPPAVEGFEERWVEAVTSSTDTTGWGEVWAAPNASRRDGSWFAITLSDDPGIREPRDTRVRDVTMADGRTAVLAANTDGTLTISFDRISIESGGIPESDLVALGSAVRIVSTWIMTPGGGTVVLADDPGERIDFDDTSLLGGLQLVWSGRVQSTPIEDVLFGTALIGAGYDRVDGTGSLAVMVLTAAPDPALVDLLRFAAAPLGYLPGAWSVPAGFTGDQLFLGRRALGRTEVMVMSWTTPEQLRVTVLADAPLDQALDLLDEVALIGEPSRDR